MLGKSGAYALKTRKKPVHKNAKLPPAKINPSKRHRDRLNVELDHLTDLLPFSKEVRGRLDKLSVLRLSVGYLKVKSYFQAVLQKNARSASLGSANGSVPLDGASFSEGEFLLQALNGFVLVVTADGTVFYASPTIQLFLGYHQSDVVHQSVYELLHMDDRDMFKCQLHFALNPSETEDAGLSSKALSSSQRLLPQYIPPENTSFLERSFCCRLRCLLENTSGFLALNFKGRLKYLHLQDHDRADGNAAPPQLALFAIVTPVQPPSVMEIRTKTLLFQTKHRLDFAPLGIDTRGKLLLGYTETELVTQGSGYQFIHAADMMHCADTHLRMIKTGETGLTIFRLLTKTRQWLWVHASARVVFKGGRPDFIIVHQKALTNEEGEEHLRHRRQQLPFDVATGEGVLYDFCLDAFTTPGPPGSGAPGSGEPKAEKPLNPASLLGSLLRQDHSIYTQSQEPSPHLQIFSQTEDEQPQASLEHVFLDSHALLSVPGHIQTLQKRIVTGDLTSGPMIDSLEQILGDIRDGGLEGLEVEETELREWERALVQMTKQRDDTLRELNQVLADDAFSYVEEALRRELGGYIQSPDQTGPHISEKIYSLSVQGRNPEFSNHEWDMTSNRSGFAEQTQLGNTLGDVGSLTELQGVFDRPPTQCRNTHQWHTSSSWPLRSSNHQCGNHMISTQSSMTDQSWLPSVQTPNIMHSSHQAGLLLTDLGSQHINNGPQLQGPSVWQQPQQLLQNSHCHSLTLPSHTPGGVSSTAHSFHQQIQQSSGCGMSEKRGGHLLNAATVPSRQIDPVLGPAGSTGPKCLTTDAARFTLSPPGVEVAGINQGIAHCSGPSAHTAACADVGKISLGHVSGDNTGVGTPPSDYAPENGSLQSSLFCWSSDAQIPL